MDEHVKNVLHGATTYFTIMKSLLERSDFVFVFIIYVSMFLDNTLLTMVVPILPYLLTDDDNNLTPNNFGTNTSRYLHPFLSYTTRSGGQPPSSSSTLGTEKAALILSCKSIVQLVANPLVATFVFKVGYLSSLFLGNIILIAASSAFATGGNFLVLMTARGLHGVASVIISVSGMCICAEKFSDDDRTRSKCMGIVLGSEAMGVLIGYTVGAFIYNTGGKSVPFFMIAFMGFTNAVFLLLNANCFSCTRIWRFTARMPLSSVPPPKENGAEKATPSSLRFDLTCCSVLKNAFIMLVLGALLLSASTVAVLEPCLPAWLIQNIKIEKWQSAFTFLPDSFGYLISTTTFGTLPHRVGKWKTATLALLLIGISMAVVPNATSLPQLAVPHFCIGLGIGTVDVVLIPMLANFVDVYPGTHYSSVYALQQAASSLAYVFGSLVGGESTHMIGFPSTVRIIGGSIILYAGIFWWYGYETSFLERTPKRLTNKKDHLIELEPISDLRYHRASFESSESD